VSERRLPVVVMRGGTSKGVFVRDADLPPAGTERDDFLLALMGSPDPMQLDGLGGSYSSTSKVVSVAPSARADSDVDYLFAQVGVDRPLVDYAGNCGNLTTAVGGYAITEGLVAAREPVTVVRLFNVNTGVRVLAHVPVAGGRVLTEGDCVVAGVPGTGAPVVTEYLDPAGAVLGTLFPTGRSVDLVSPTWVPSPRLGAADAPPGAGSPSARPPATAVIDATPGIAVCLMDVAGPVAFVLAEDVGLDPRIEPSAANADPDLLDRLEAVRGAAAVLAGLAPDPRSARSVSAALPRLAIVAPSADDSADLVVRVTSMQRVHHALPMTVLLGTAAAARLPGTLAHAVARPGGSTVRVAHPKGVSEAAVHLDGTEVRSVSITRTARRLFAGEAYLR
jgi:2-methylaconitate cis-trans-isomerase PrpF